MRGLSLVAASGGHSSSWCAGLSLSRPLLLQSIGSRRTGSVAMAHRPSRSAACGIFPDQGSDLCPLHWQADSQPLRHQGNPPISFIVGLLVMNALGCLSSENVFTSSSFRKDIFTGYRIRLFSFNTLKMLFHCLLASIVSNEKSIVI